MRHDEPDEADRAGEGDDARGEQRRAGEDPELEPLGVDAELLRRLLAEGQEVQLPRARQDQPQPRRRAEREEPERGRRERPEVAQEPVDDAAKPVHVHDGDHQGDRRGEEEPDDDARQQQRLHRQAPGAGDQVDGRGRDDGPREGERRQPRRAEEPETEPQALADHHPEGGAAGDAEHRRLRERVAGERLEGHAGHGQRAAGERGGGDPRQPDRERHDALDRLRPGAPRERGEDGAGRDRGAAEEERERGGRQQHERQGAEDRGEVPAGAQGKASGWIARASASRPSTTRGP